MGSKPLKIWNGLDLTPRSTDPTDPQEGWIFYSDGTLRAKGLWKYEDGAWREIGGDGGVGLGDADTLHLIRVDDIELVDITVTGKNVTPDGGGIITPSSLTISDVAAELLRGDTVIKYLPGVNGQGDYWGWEREIPLGDRQSNIGFQLMYKNTATTLDNDFIFWVKQMNGTMLGHVAEFNLPAHYSDGTGKTIRTDSFVAHDCTLIRFGIQNKSATTTVGINIDNILVTANPFVRTQMLDHQYVAWRSITPITWESNYADIPSTPTENRGANIVQWTSTATGVEFTVNRECLLTLKLQALSESSSAPVQRTYIRRNGFDVGTSGAITVHNPDTTAGEYPAIFKGLAVPGEVYKLYTTGTTATNYLTVEVNAQAEKEGIVHVGGAGIQYYRANGATGYGSTNNKIPHYLNVLSNDENGAYGTIEDDSTYGWSFTAKKPCMATFSVYGAAATVYDLGFSLNSSQLTTAWYSITEDSKLPGMLGGAYAGSTSSATVRLPLKVGDVVRPHTDGNVMVSGKNQIIAIAEPLPNYTIITPMIQAMNVEVGNPEGYNIVGRSTAYKTRPMEALNGDIFGAISLDQLKVSAGKYIFKVPVGGLGNTGPMYLGIYDAGNATYLYDKKVVDAVDDYTYGLGMITVFVILEFTEAKTLEFRTKSTNIGGLSSGEMIGNFLVTKLKSN